MEVTDTDSPKSKLWNGNFILLWQGQFVSALGDVVYEIALGFWVLAMTGSTALMGTLLAASTVPRVLLSPFAGVVVDRADRKRLLVAMDLMRGIFVVLVAIAAYTGNAHVWMVFIVGIANGLCSAFFNPAISSVIPDIVTREKLVQANSFFSMIRAGSGILGNSIGGLLYATLGAPLMFLVNGISYLVSSGTEVFLKIPSVHKERGKKFFFTDLKDGLKFVWENTGLRFLMLAAGLMNFFFSVSIVLMIPLFQRTEWLGPARYGIAMAVFTTSMVLGMATTATIKIPAEKRLFLFGLGTVLFIVPLVFFPFFNVFWPMLICMVFGGYFNAVVNVLINSVLQLGVPQEHRGKVFGLLETLTQGLTPVGLALGGILGEFIPLKWVIGGAIAIIGMYIFPQLKSRGLREFFSVSAEPARSGDTTEQDT
jgi:MFS transporter, DHA3 family, macrolide efflux protein